LQTSNYFIANATIAINASGINSELAEPAAWSIVDATTGASMTGSLMPPAKAVVAAAAKTVAKVVFSFSSPFVLVLTNLIAEPRANSIQNMLRTKRIKFVFANAVLELSCQNRNTS